MPDTYDDVVYHGHRQISGGSLITVETRDGSQIGVVRHVQRHSPTGMTWGYAGSGPADCARSLLIAALGEDLARCQACNGTAKVVFVADGQEIPLDPAHAAQYDAEQISRCGECDDGYRRLPYQQFKFSFVASWGDEWRMSRAAIRAWLDGQSSA